jgi:endonuclease-8
VQDGPVPEGDTVWLATRRLHDALAGDRLTRTDFRVPRYATTDLGGQLVESARSRGKHILIRTDAALTLHTHFEMDGSWHLYRPGSRWSGGPDSQVRLVLETAQWQAVGYRIPVIDVLPTDDEHRLVGHLGPDLLGEDWDEAEALARLMRDARRQVGPALLDQRNLAGIGNLYKAETLFLAGVTPWTTVGEVPDLASVVRIARRLMLANRDHWQQSTTGALHRGEQHWVFERTGRPCRRCATPIASSPQPDDGHERISYWCPRCQAGPAPDLERPARRARPPAGSRRYVP